MIRVALPYHLRTLGKIESAEVRLEVAAPVTVRRVLDALEARYPMLAGTIREHGTGKAAGVYAGFCVRGRLVA